MGRHSIFNKQQVLADALDLFWERGFTPASMKQLETVTDMHPGSLYYHFQNKEQLYIACLKYYLEWHLKPRIDRYLVYSNSIDSLRRFYTCGYRNPEDYKFRNSCFLINASHELHLLPEQAATLTQEGLSLLRSGLTEHLKQAIEKNTLTITHSLDGVTNELANLYISLQLQNRIVPNQHRMDEQVKLCLSCLVTPIPRNQNKKPE